MHVGKQQLRANCCKNLFTDHTVFAGHLISGYLADVFDCYTWPFIMAGILTQIAGLLPLVLFCLGEKKSFDLKKNTTREEPMAIYRQLSIESTSTRHLYNNNNE